MKFEKVILNDVAIVYDSLHKSPKYTEKGIPMVRVRDLDYGFLKLEDTVFVDRDTYEEFSKKHKPTKGDIIFSRVGSYGITSYVDSDEVFCLGQNTVSIVSKEIDSKFLYYTLLSPMVRQQIEMVVTGSTQKTISLKNIRNLTLFIPKREEQQKISSFLYSLDKKIDNNGQLISNLEELAQTLFKRWFVDFEFPNEEGKPYKSSGGKMVESELGMIPKGWSMGTLSDIAEVVMGQSPKSSTYNDEKIGTPLINGASDFKKDKIEPLKHTTDPKRLSQKGDYLFGVRATVGNVTYVDGEYALGRGVGVARVKDKKYGEYLYFHLINGINRLKYGATGSVYINFTRNDLTNMRLVMSSREIIELFHENTLSIFEEKHNLLKQNKSLVILRDTLLPKLLSGEIELPDDMEVTDDVPIS